MTLSATGRFTRFRRLARLLAVPMLLALLGAQHAALLHGLGHAATLGELHVAVAGGTSAASGAGGTDAGAHCDKCFQFAHFSGLALAAAPVPLLASLAGESANGERFSARAADAPPASSRGPPKLL